MLAIAAARRLQIALAGSTLAGAVTVIAAMAVFCAACGPWWVRISHWHLREITGVAQLNGPARSAKSVSPTVNSWSYGVMVPLRPVGDSPARPKAGYRSVATGSLSRGANSCHEANSYQER